MNYPARIKQLQTLMQSNSLDAFLVSNFYNILYLTGFAGLAPDENESWLLITKKNIYHISDDRYRQTLKDVSENFDKNYKINFITPDNNLVKIINNAVVNDNLVKIGFEALDLKYHYYNIFKNQLNNCQLISNDQLLISLRQIKDEVEIELLIASAKKTDEIYKKLLPFITPQKTEKQIFYHLIRLMLDFQVEAAFDPIIAADQNSAIAHYSTKNGNNKIINSGSVILIDFGIVQNHYVSDFTRIILMESASNQIKNHHQQLKSIHQNAIKKIRPGVIIKDIDSYCREQILNSGLNDYKHSTGHGIGLEIHEYPKINSVNNDLIKQNQVFTIEPAIYIPGKYGLRLEDTVLVTSCQNKTFSQTDT